MLKGAIHTHSTYSDGEFTLPELRRLLMGAGCDFVCMTDHAEHFDEAKMRDYVSECALLSDNRFRFIAGLEFECIKRMHILGLGVTELVNSQDPVQVIRHIESHGGVSVVAHPKNDFFSWIETFDELPNGIEAWNTKYDGRYAPRTSTFDLLGRLQERDPGMKAFYGIDLHWRHQYRGLLNRVHCDSLSREEILGALAMGNYDAFLNGWTLPSSGRLPASLIRAFDRAHERSDSWRQLVKKVKVGMTKCHVTVPGRLKDHLRRLF